MKISQAKTITPLVRQLRLLLRLLNKFLFRGKDSIDSGILKATIFYFVAMILLLIAIQSLLFLSVALIQKDMYNSVFPYWWFFDAKNRSKHTEEVDSVGEYEEKMFI